MRKARTYKTANNYDPFTIWVNKLDKKIKVRVYKKVNSLEAGNYSDCSILKSTNGIREARIRTVSGIRIYFIEEGQEIIILLAGGNKSTQEKDIIKAQEYLNDYKRRKNNNE
jgi:putative addiction module killer protein